MSRMSAAMQQNAAPSTRRGIKAVNLETNARFVLPEDEFRRVLCAERKRSERSRKNLVLMLIDHGHECGEKVNACPLLTQVAGALRSAIRETDVAGWFDGNCALGVIFTEFGDSHVSVAAKAIEAKITNSLQQGLTTQLLSKIHISFYPFPDSWSKNGRAINSVLYPDLVEVQEKRKLSLLTKRCMDIIGSFCALVVLSPIFFMLAVLIKLTSRGPVAFRQERVGQYGSRFILLKFRSMHLSTDETIHKEYVRKFIAGNTEAASSTEKNKKPYKITNDPRVTWIGKLMRRTSLDELPQFWNVLRGEMSLVGPRPPIPYELEAYDLWHRRRLLEAKPGITGPWQVYGRSKTTFDEMVRLDLEYSRSWSPMLDVKLLLQTPRAVVSGDGAY
jgi:lipopolysaccharide/colanic/teichoic acid biosynthesis glycosyltransferase